MIIRILLLFGMAATGWLVFLRRNRLPIHIMTVFVLLAAGAVAVVFPDSAQAIANFVGVGRAADLVAYIAVIAVMFVLLHYYTKFVEQQQQITELTRELAIMRVEIDRLARASSPTADDNQAAGNVAAS